MFWGSSRTGTVALRGLDAGWGRLAQKYLFCHASGSTPRVSKASRNQIIDVVITFFQTQKYDIAKVSSIVTLGGLQLRHVLVTFGGG